MDAEPVYKAGMIRFVLRFAGLLLFALAFVFVIYDGTRSIADRTVVMVRLDEFWSGVDSESLTAFQGFIQDSLPAFAWTHAAQPVLAQPASLVFLVLGIVLVLLGRPKKPMIGYARD